MLYTFHANWFYVAVATTGIVGLWGVGLALARRSPNRAFELARAAAFGAMGLQVAAGVALYVTGARPGNAFHVFYGIVIAFVFAFVYLYRAQLERRPALAYGLVLLFVMGLGIRAWMNVR